MNFYVHDEVIQNMTEFEKNELMNELKIIMQNQEARVAVTKEGGFRQLWRVLTGKQEVLENQIILDQLEINKITFSILMQLSKKQAEQSNDLNEMSLRIYELERIVPILCMYIMRQNKEITDLGGTPEDTTLLEQYVEEALKEKESLSERIEKIETPKNEKELGEAIKNDADEIWIEGKLASTVFAIHFASKNAWVAIAASLVIAIGAFIALAIPDPAEGLEAGAGIAGLTAATVSYKIVTISALQVAPALMAGTSASAVAFSSALIGASGGGIASLNKLRSYELIKAKGSKKAIMLKKKR